MNERIRVQGGKLYTKVVDRLTAFKEKYHPDKGFFIQTNITTLTDNYVVFKAEILNKEGVILATGHGFNAIAKEKSLEKAETVAVGRALAFFDPMYGGESELASQEEIEKWEDLTKDDGSQFPQTQKVPTGVDKIVDKAMNQMNGNSKELKDGVCNFPKHKGKMWSQVAGEDLDYLKWITSSVDDLDDKTKSIISQFV